MKNIVIKFPLVVAAVLFASSPMRSAGQSFNVSSFPDAATVTPAPPATTSAWPVVFSSGEATYTVFAPQSDSWDGHDLVARSAVSVQSASDLQPSFGVVTFSAITLVDKTTRTARLADVHITRADFPSDGGQTPAYLAWLRQEFPKRAPTMSLDRLETGLNLDTAPAKAESLNNMPPKIIIATRPAVLVYIDGPPA